MLYLVVLMPFLPPPRTWSKSITANRTDLRGEGQPLPRGSERGRAVFLIHPKRPEARSLRRQSNRLVQRVEKKPQQGSDVLLKKTASCSVQMKSQYWNKHGRCSYYSS